MSEDALRLFSEDRQRFLALYLDFLRNADIPPGKRMQEARATENAIRQLTHLADGS